MKGIYFTSYFQGKWLYLYLIKVWFSKEFYFIFHLDSEDHKILSIFEQTQIGTKEAQNAISFQEILRLKSGSSFGELALLNTGGGIRTAKVIWRKDCKFATVNKEKYQKVLGKMQQQNKDNMINFLKQIPFISHWSKNALSKLYYGTETVKTHRGKEIISEGDPIENIWI